MALQPNQGWWFWFCGGCNCKSVQAGPVYKCRNEKSRCKSANPRKLQVRSPRLSSVRLMIWALLMMNCFWIAILRKGKVMPRGCYSHKAARKLVLRRQEGRMLGSPIRYCSIEACCSGKA